VRRMDVVMGLECCCGSFWTGGELEFIPCVRRGGILILELRWLTLQQRLGTCTFYSTIYTLFTSITAAAAAPSSPSSRP
jgi:hypothetical protein